MMAFSDDVNIRESIAGNPSTPPLVFDILAKDAIEVKRALATNIHLVEPYISQLILQNDDPYLVFALAKNPVLEAEHMESISKKFSYAPALFISNHNCPEDILRTAYASMEKEGADAIEMSKKIEMCKEFINNPSTPLNILAKLFLSYPMYKDRILENIRFNYPMFEGASDKMLITSLTRQVTPIY